MMKQYRINKTTTFVEDNRSENREKYLLPDYKVQVKFAGIWITVKSFHDEDEEYAKNCANELLEKLNENTKHFEQSGYDWCSGSYYA